MTKQNEKYGMIKEIFNSIEGVDLHEKKRGRFYYTLHLTPKMEEADIEALDLGVRAYNGLKRAGYNTVGQLVAGITSGEDIRRIRNCGVKSYSESMERLFLYNLVNIQEGKREQFILDTIEKNRRAGDGR